MNDLVCNINTYFPPECLSVIFITDLQEVNSVIKIHSDELPKNSFLVVQARHLTAKGYFKFRTGTKLFLIKVVLFNFDFLIKKIFQIPYLSGHLGTILKSFLVGFVPRCLSS